MNAAVQVAEQLPDVKFEHCTGYKTAPNLAAYDARIYEGRAVYGAHRRPHEQDRERRLHRLGPDPGSGHRDRCLHPSAARGQPRRQIRIIWVNSWYDPGKEADAAKALIDQGADIIVQHTAVRRALQVAEERGVHGLRPSIGHEQLRAQRAADRHRVPLGARTTSSAPERSGPDLGDPGRLGGPEAGWSRSHPTGRRCRPRWRPRRTGSSTRSSRARCTRSRGRIRNQAGKLVSPEGKGGADEDLLGMDYYVQGIRAARSRREPRVSARRLAGGSLSVPPSLATHGANVTSAGPRRSASTAPALVLAGRLHPVSERASIAAGRRPGCQPLITRRNLMGSASRRGDARGPRRAAARAGAGKGRVGLRRADRRPRLGEHARET